MKLRNLRLGTVVLLTAESELKGQKEGGREREERRENHFRTVGKKINTNFFNLETKIKIRGWSATFNWIM